MSLPSNEPSRLITDPACAVFLFPTDALAEIVHPASKTSFKVRSSDIFRLLAFASEPRTASELAGHLERAGASASEANGTIDELRRARVLRAAAEKRSSEGQWEKYGWQEALHLQLATSNESFADECDPHNEARIAVLSEYLAAELKVVASGSGSECTQPFGEANEASSAFLDVTLDSLLKERRTTRTFHSRFIGSDMVRTLLRGATDMKRRASRCVGEDIARNPTALLPSLFAALELRAIVHRVTDMAPGVYDYDVQKDSLRLLNTLRDPAAADACVVTANWGQSMPSGTCVSIFIIADFQRQMWQYRYPRAYRNLLISAGELGQLLLVVGQSLGLRTCMTPALRDSYIKDFLRIAEPDRDVVYYLGFGL